MVVLANYHNTQLLQRTFKTYGPCFSCCSQNDLKRSDIPCEIFSCFLFNESKRPFCLFQTWIVRSDTVKIDLPFNRLQFSLCILSLRIKSMILTVALLRVFLSLSSFLAIHLIPENSASSRSFRESGWGLAVKPKSAADQPAHNALRRPLLLPEIIPVETEVIPLARVWGNVLRVIFVNELADTTSLSSVLSWRSG